MAGLRLADLIDLELELQRDRARPIEQLHERDARIAREIDAASLEGRPLYLGWLSALRREGGAQTGLRLQSFLELLGLALFALGLISGAGTVAGWLAAGDGRPVNVVNLWPVLVGVQLLLLAGWLLSTRRDVLQGLGGLLPSLVGLGVARLASGHGESLRAALGELRKLDWLYGRLRFWRTTALSQTFAVAFNLGALGALVGIPYVDDPAFGWRSRLLDAGELHALARGVALPWSAWLPEGVPSREEVDLTRYSSVDPRFAAPAGGAVAGPVWAAWWPFLVASLLLYGLAPRLVIWTLARLRVRRELERAALDHADFQRLRERLRRPSVDTRATERDAAAAPGAGELPAMDRSIPLGDGSARVLRWEGVGLDDERVRELLHAELGTSVASLHAVGGLDPAADQTALEALRDAEPDTAVALLVQAWEPPVADHVDLLARIRRVLGDGRPLVVLLHATDAAGLAAPAAERELDVWRRRLAALGDPWLRVEALISGEPA